MSVQALLTCHSVLKPFGGLVSSTHHLLVIRLANVEPTGWRYQSPCAVCLSPPETPAPAELAGNKPLAFLIILIILWIPLIIFTHTV